MLDLGLSTMWTFYEHGFWRTYVRLVSSHLQNGVTPYTTTLNILHINTYYRDTKAITDIKLHICHFLKFIPSSAGLKLRITENLLNLMV